jgi:GxxExxY protein
LIDGKLVLELKAVEALNDTFKAQTVSYLVALGLELGLLINFNVANLKQGLKRVVNDFPLPS